MRRLALSLILAIAPASAFAASLGVPLNQAVIISLGSPARDVVVGNPAIADVTVSDTRHLVVTGKTPGVTNLMVTSASGRLILNRQVVVGASSGDRVALINGPTLGGSSPSLLSYACAPTCEQVGAGHVGGGQVGLVAPAPAMAAPAPSPSASVTPSPTTP
jgi:hypothetical protein